MFTPELVQIYLQLLPTAGYVALTSFLLTPIIGFLAVKYHFVDLPATKRKRTDKSLAQRIHKKTKPRLGGIAYLLPILFILITQIQGNQQVLGLAIGLGILMLIGALDDKYELPAKTQLLSQFFAAAIVVILGVKILNVDVAGLNLNFDWWQYAFNFFQLQISIVFPADFITIIWILLIINAVNWMYGMDSIGEAMSVVAAITTALLSVRAGLYENALLSLSLAGGILGFIPFNLYPSKIIGGTAGATGNGYLLAVLAILSGAKFSNAIMLLIFPLFDMLWVIVYRLNKHRDEPFLKRPFISGKVHFHHRLMTLGFSQRQILFIETILISAIAIVGTIMSGFSNTFLFLIISIGTLLILFSLISIFARRKENKLIEEIKKSNAEADRIENKPPDDDIPPEERFAY